MKHAEFRPEPILAIENLSVSYGKAPALKGINLEIRAGECLAIVGESGSGKTTLVKAILGLLPSAAKVTQGAIRWSGGGSAGAVDLLRAPKLRRKLLGEALSYIPQSPLLSFDPLVSVGRQAVEPLELHGQLHAPWREAASELLNSVGIDHPEMRAGQHSFELSGGMLQRILLASALSTNPRLVLADEPTASLDMLSQQRVLDLIDTQVASHGAALLLITHDLGMALDRADTVIVMRNGEIVEAGPAQKIARAPRDDYARRLLAHVARSTGHAAPAAVAEAKPASSVPTLEVRAISKTFAAPEGEAQSARRPGAQEVSFRIDPGRTLVLVGESGSGKSTVANMVSGQFRPDSGEILLKGEAINRGEDWVKSGLWKQIQLIHQDSISTFDPRYSAAEVIMEPLRNLGAKDPQAEARALLDLVGLNPDLATRQARSLSGGQGQRLAIARALAVRPPLLLLDEAVSALDVLVREHVLELLRRLQREFGLAYLFITHDLSVARDFADEILVMRAGRVIERGTPEALTRAPSHDYTRRLMAAIPGQRFLSAKAPTDAALVSA